ncbi:hypothetical protein EGW08_017673, partial [Elysia chlorotica]
GDNSNFKFISNFQNVISNIRRIEEHYASFPEPDPDYLNEDEESGSGGGGGGRGTDGSSKPQQPQRRSPGWKVLPHQTNGTGTGASDVTSDDFPPPPPPLTAEELASSVMTAQAQEAQGQGQGQGQHKNGISPSSSGGGGGGGGPPQIKPKPLHNPCLESRERQALHRELISNYKLGKDVLQKPELNKVLRERRETQRKKEWEEQKQSKGRTSLELKLEERRVKE